MTEFIIAWNTQVVVLQNPFTTHTTTNDKLKKIITELCAQPICFTINQ